MFIKKKHIKEIATWVEPYTNREYSKLDEYLNEFDNLNIDLKNKTILDLGAGPGTWEFVFSKYEPKKIIWYDISEDFFRIAKEKHKNIKNVVIEYKIGEMSDLPYTDNSFDFVFSRVALYHAKNERNCFKEIGRVLKKGGYFYCETHNWKRVMENYSWLNGKKIPALILPFVDYFFNIKPVTPLHQLEFFIKRQLKKNNFKNILYNKSGNRIKILCEKIGDESRC